MANYPATLDSLLAAWNESDPALIRQHLENALHPNVRFADPTVDITGIDAFEKNLREVNANIPGAVYSRTSGVDMQHNFHRYHWAIHQNGERVLAGFDVTETDDAGKVLQIIGFFGDIPPA